MTVAGRLIFPVVFLVTLWSGATVHAVDQPTDPKRQETVPAPVPPSTMDPGIQKQPNVVPSPESAVQPPNVDPGMAVDPEKTPPATKPNIPKQPKPESRSR